MRNEKNRKCTAANERFHASGGVTRPKGSANLQVLCPAQTVVSRRLREAAATLCAIFGQNFREARRGKLKIILKKKLIYIETFVFLRR
jgi:hypothetical protein